MLPATAIVDVLEQRPAPALTRWRVEVWGKAPQDYTLVYEIHAKNEMEAADEGLGRFNKDVQQLIEQEKKK